MLIYRIINRYIELLYIIVDECYLDDVIQMDGFVFVERQLVGLVLFVLNFQSDEKEMEVLECEIREISMVCEVLGLNFKSCRNFVYFYFILCIIII